MKIDSKLSPIQISFMLLAAGLTLWWLTAREPASIASTTSDAINEKDRWVKDQETKFGKSPTVLPWNNEVVYFKKHMESKLTDAGSLKIDQWNQPVPVEQGDGTKGWAIIVQYRAKNSFGAYTEGSARGLMQGDQIVQFQMD